MTKWLCQQDSIYLQDLYLTWHHSLHSDLKGHDPGDPGTADAHQSDSEQDSDSDSDSEGEYEVARNPSPPTLHTDIIVRHLDHFVMERHGTPLLCASIETYLRATFPLSPQPIHICPSDHIDGFKYITMLGPSHQHVSETKCLLDARQKPTPAMFNTMLIVENPEWFMGDGVADMRVGQIKLVFKLPLSGLPLKMRHPLAYVHWFYPLQNFDDHMKIF
ncbi:hypothetical protein BDN67DRAFT_1015386 [Paxillus ammoniavirescens]|nr:hypothetical protein BDN67DRAFT_1015386 [Paxillus ammoniavirescens]